MGETEDKANKGSLTGRLSGIRVRNRQTGFTIFELQTEDGKIVCKGHVLNDLPGILLCVHGEWENDPKWGRQLICGMVIEVEGDRRSIMETVKTVPGIGNKTAERIVDALISSEGAAAPENSSRKLQTVRGITKDKAVEIAVYLKLCKEKRRLWELLCRFEVRSLAVVQKIFDEYGERSVAELRKDPYSVGVPAGISFSVCEKIAHDSGITAGSSVRVRAIIRNSIDITSNNGHTCYPYPDFVEEVRKKADSYKTNLYSEAISVPTIMLMLDACCGSFLVKEKGMVYLRDLRRAEVSAANSIKRLLQSAAPTNHDPDKLCSLATIVSGVIYEGKQREAFRLLGSGGVGILTGGPGTGKTTTLNGLITAYERMFPFRKIKLCAPTGRASQRLREAAGREASTIHRLLEARIINGVFTCKDRNNPIDADLIILDEASMVSIEVVALLLEAVRSGAMVILSGDVDQLPSVGPGNVLHDLLHCTNIPSVALDRTRRQAADSLIIENAARILDGNSNLKEGQDFKIIKAANDTAIARELMKLFLELYDPNDIFSTQVLTPARKRIPGISSSATVLNEMMQAQINPSGPSLHYGDTTLRVGDKIMMMRNNYDVGYYNGDIGTIADYSSGSLSLHIDGQAYRIGQECFGDISLSYATSIHKSQGSEFDNVIVVLPPKPRNMLRCNLLYTAVTRARKRVWLITVPGCIGAAVGRRGVTKRYSRLRERICA